MAKWNRKVSADQLSNLNPCGSIEQLVSIWEIMRQILKGMCDTEIYIIKTENQFQR